MKIERERLNFAEAINENRFIAVCTISAFFVRLFLIPKENVIGWDGVYYSTLGEKIISGNIYGGISAYWSPLYSFLIGIFYPFFHDSESAGRFVSMIAGALLVIPVYYLIRDFYGRLPASIGTILVIIHPDLIRSSMWVMTESLFTLIFVTGMLTVWYALSGGKTRNFFLTGILFGTAYLIKPEVIGFLGLIFVLLIGTKILTGKFSFRFAAKNYLLLLLGFGVFFLPYVAFVYQKTGNLTISQKLLNNISSVDYGKGSLELIDGQSTMKDRLFGDIYKVDRQPVEIASVSNPSIVKSPPVQFHSEGVLSKTYYNLKKLLESYFLELFPFPFIFILLIIIGFFYQPWTRTRTMKEIFLASFFVCTIIGYAVTVIQVRYLFPILPILIAWIANAIVQFGDWASNSASDFLETRRKINPIFAQACTFLIIAAVLVYSIPSQMLLENKENLPFEEKQAGLWIKNNADTPAPLIMAQGPIVAYYARGNHIYLPNESLSTVIDYAKRKNVNYLVFSERRVKDTPRVFSGGEENLPENLQLVYKDEQNPNYKINIYRLSD